MLNRADSDSWELVTVTGSGATRTQLAAALAEMEKRDGRWRCRNWEADRSQVREPVLRSS